MSTQQAQLWAVTFANSVLTVTPQEEYYGKELIVADRDLVEQEADEILKDADVTDVAFLVVGDPFGWVVVWGGGCISSEVNC